MKFDAFVNGSGESKALAADCEKTINWYYETIQSEGATARKILAPTPGVTAVSTPAANSARTVGRAHYVIGSREFAVIGKTLYEIDSAGTATTRGTGISMNALSSDTASTGSRGRPAPDQHPVTMSGGGDLTDQILITGGRQAYLYTMATATLSTITAMADKATMGAYLDGYFLALDQTTSKLYISALGNGATWTTGTDYAQRSMAPDPWVSMVTAGRFAWLLGLDTSEIWQNVGSQSFPFAPHPSGLVQFGIGAPWSAKNIGQDVFWLARAPGGRRCVVQASGFSPQIISDTWLEAKLEEYRYPEQAIGDTYSIDGHMFYVLHFDRDNASWAFDVRERKWHQPLSWNATAGQYTAWRPRWHAYAYNEHRMLDSSGGNVWKLTSDSTVDANGVAIRRLRRAPAIIDNVSRVFYSSFELDVEPVPPTTSRPTTDYQVMLRWSDDGGRFWSSEHWRSAAQMASRVRWLRLGSGRRRVFEVVVADGAPWRVAGAHLGIVQQVEA